MKTLLAASDLISSEIRHEYTLGYVPSNRLFNGKFRRVRVIVKPERNEKVRVTYRSGYYLRVNNLRPQRQSLIAVLRALDSVVVELR